MMQTKTDDRAALCRDLAAKQKDPGIDLIVVKDLDIEIKAATPEGLIPVIASTEDRDRDGDVIMANGWDLKSFKKNPVILWAHDYSTLPIGKAHNTRKGDGRLVSDMEFTPHDLNPLGDTVGRMFRAGFLNAVSVGFKPTKFEPLGEDKDSDPVASLFGGIRFLKQSLLEYSAVPVPSNPHALAGAKAAGIDMSPIKEWTERVLEGDSPAALWMPRDLVEEMRKAINTGRVFGLHHVEPRGTDEQRAALRDLTVEGQKIQNAIDAQHVNGEQRSIPGEVGGIVGDLDPEVFDPPPASLVDVTGEEITMRGIMIHDANGSDDSIGGFKIGDQEYTITRDGDDLIAVLKGGDEDNTDADADADASTESDEAAPPPATEQVEHPALQAAKDFAEQRREEDPIYLAAKKLSTLFLQGVENQNAAAPQEE